MTSRSFNETIVALRYGTLHDDLTLELNADRKSVV